ncbi:5-deoxy-glucuronate isomerase [Pseudomonadota bacterium]
MNEKQTENLRFKLLNVSSKQKMDITHKGYEATLVILSGECKVTVQGSKKILRRKNVFEEKATALYIPSGMPFVIEAQVDSELGLCLGRSEKQEGLAFFIEKDSVHCRTVGKEKFERVVCDIVDQRIAAEHLVVGETFNGPGQWSSFPPHKHDTDNLPQEAKMEEIYFFKVDPPEGFGFQRLYSPELGEDNAIVIMNNSVVPIRDGYHPVCVMPGCRLYYLWFLWGENRTLAPFEDPELRAIDYDMSYPSAKK